jgi:hypothetical protein
MEAFMKNQRLALQIWDCDITADDCGGEVVLDLTSPWFRRVFARKKARPTFWEPFDEDWNKRLPDKAPHKLHSNLKALEMESRFTTLADAAQELLAKESLLSEEVDEELEAAKFWLPLQRPVREKQSERRSDERDLKKHGLPKLLLSVQLVPTDDIDKLPAGFGRSAPNTNPALPKPVGRLQWTLNPVRRHHRSSCRSLAGVDDPAG